MTRNLVTDQGVQVVDEAVHVGEGRALRAAGVEAHRAAVLERRQLGGQHAGEQQA